MQLPESNSCQRVYALPLPVSIADGRARKWAAQGDADVAHIKEASSQWEDAPEHRQHPERVMPEHKADDEERCAGHHAEDASRPAIEEMREPRTIERLLPSHGRFPELRSLVECVANY